MNIEISEQTTERIAALIGSSDPLVIGQFIDRLAEDDQTFQALFQAGRSEAEVRQSAALCEQALHHMREGGGKPFDAAIDSIRNRLGFTLPQ